MFQLCFSRVTVVFQCWNTTETPLKHHWNNSPSRMLQWCFSECFLVYLLFICWYISLCHFFFATLNLLCCNFAVNLLLMEIFFPYYSVAQTYSSTMVFTSMGDVFKTFREGQLFECNLIDLWTSYLNDQIEHAKPVRRFSVPTYTTVSNFSLTAISNECCFF